MNFAPQVLGRLLGGVDIPTLSALASDGTVLFDRSLPRQLSLGGQVFDPRVPLSVHERTEGFHMDRGLSYEQAHTLATQAEDQWAARRGLDPKAYQKLIGAFAEQVASRPVSEIMAGLRPEHQAVVEDIAKRQRSGQDGGRIVKEAGTGE